MLITIHLPDLMPLKVKYLNISQTWSQQILNYILCYYLLAFLLGGRGCNTSFYSDFSL